MNQKLPLQHITESTFETQSSSKVSENILRPKTLKEYVGQKNVTGKLEVFISAALGRGDCLDHLLLSGPPGLGKTTLAHIVSKEMSGQIHLTSGPALEKPVDLVALLTGLKEGDILFIDEIHRLSAVVEESIYPAMEDFEIQVILGEGAAAQAVNIPVPKFTLIGATTQAGKLTGPLRDRFGIQMNLEFYEVDEMEKIISRSANLLGVELTDSEINSLAVRTRGTPRIANRLLARVRDFIQVFQSDQKNLSSRALEEINKSQGNNVVEQALEFLQVDPTGLQPLDHEYLQTIINNYHGGPVGIESIAASLSEDRTTLEEMVEPFLLKKGLLIRTSRGRAVTDKTYQLLGIKKKVDIKTKSTDQKSLF